MQTDAESAALSEASIRDRIATKRIQKAFALWEAQSAEDRLTLLQDFREQSSIDAYRRDIQRRGVACIVSIALRTAFCEWYAQRTWGNISEEELLAFADAEAI